MIPSFYAWVHALLSSKRPFHVKMPKAKVQDYPELGPRLNSVSQDPHQHTATSVRNDFCESISHDAPEGTNEYNM